MPAGLTDEELQETNKFHDTGAFNEQEEEDETVTGGNEKNPPVKDPPPAPKPEETLTAKEKEKRQREKEKAFREELLSKKEKVKSPVGYVNETTFEVLTKLKHYKERSYNWIIEDLVRFYVNHEEFSELKKVIKTEIEV